MFQSLWFKKFVIATVFMGTLVGCSNQNAFQEFLEENGQAPVVEIPDDYQGGGNSIVRFSKTAGDQQNAVLGSPAAVPLKVTLLTSAGLPDSGKTVFFAVVGGAAYGSVSSSTVTTDTDGTAQVTFTSGTETGAVSVLASTSGLNSLTFTINVAGVSVYAIQKVPTSNGNSQTANIGSVLPLPFKVVVTNTTNSSVVPNVSVRFLATQGTVGGSFSGNAYVDILTDENGIATSPAMTLNTTSGSHTVRAFLVGSPSIFTDFTATGAVLSNSTIDADLSSLTLSATTTAADGAANVIATVRVKDQYGNLIPNNTQSITLNTTPTTTGNNIGSLAIWDTGSWSYASVGTYTRTMSVNTEAGSISFDSLTVSGVTITSTLPSLTLTANNSIDPSKSAISTSTGTLTANGITTATVIVTLKDFFNNQVSESGHSVIISNDVGVLSAATLAYHAGSGTYRTFFTTPTSVGSGSATFTIVSVDGTPVVGKTASISLTSGPATSVAVSSGNAPTGVHDTAVPAFVAVVKDANNNVVPNETVNWSIDSGGGALSSSSNNTNSSGLSSTTLTLGASLGVTTVRAALNSNASIYTTFTATSTTALFTMNWPFTAGTSSSYMPSSGDWLTSTLEMSGGVCKLTPSDQTDDDNSATGGFNGGTYRGIASYGLLQGEGSSNGLRLGNNGGCDGSVTNCFGELDETWTPQWNSLVSYWKMNNNWQDSKGTNHGTAYGDATFTAENRRLGTHAGTFDGTGDYVRSATDTNLPLVNTARSISVWVRPLAFDKRVLFWGTANNGQGMGIYLVNSTTINFYAWNLDCSVTVPTLTAGNWIHVVATHSGTTSTVYLNGSLINTCSRTLNTVSSGNVYIGWDAQGGSVQGNIDDAAIWSTPLTAAEVKTIYDRQAPKYAGDFTSRVMDAKATGQTWTSLSWVPTLPFFKALPDYASGSLQNETSTDYTSLVGSTGSTGANNLMQGLVGLWHLDEPVGTTGSGSVKNNAGTNLVTTPGSATVFGGEGKLGKAAYFNGTGNAIITTAYDSVLNHQGAFTASAWVKVTSSTAWQGFISNTKTTNPYSGYVLYASGNGSKAVCALNGLAAEITGSVTINDGVWHYLACVFNGTSAKLYVDGVQDGNTANYVAGAMNSGSTPMHFGSYMGDPGRVPTGFIDEVAIWNRALHENEIKQLYQRGASRLKFQVRSCNDELCAGETWQGPDGTAGTYFSELFNVSAQSASPPSTVTVKKDLPSMTFSSFTSPPSTNRYFQYRTIFESDTANTTLMPELKSVTVAPVHYDTSSPWVYGKTGVDYYSLSAFTETLGSSCAGGIGYNLGVGATAATATWYWWDSAKASDCSTAGSGAWCVAGGTVATSNSASDVHTNRAAFGTQIGTGKVYVKAFLKSNGSTPCELDNVQLDVEQ